MGTVHWIGIQIQCSMQTHCFEKTFNLIYIKLKKCLIVVGSSGSNGWARVKSERTYSREPLLRTIFFDSRHLQIARGRPTWNENIINTDNAQWKEPELTTLISEVSGSTNMQSMQARVLQKRSRRLGLIPSAGIATADTWCKCFCTKTIPRKYVLVLVDLSTLGIPQTCSICMSKRQLKKRTVTSIISEIDTRISLRCQAALHFIARHRQSMMTVWSRTIIRKVNAPKLLS